MIMDTWVPWWSVSIMRVNVIGATGQRGRRVVQALLDQGIAPEDLIISAHTPEKDCVYTYHDVIVRSADYDQPETLVEAFQESDVLMLIPTGWRLSPGLPSTRAASLAEPFRAPLSAQRRVQSRRRRYPCCRRSSCTRCPSNP